MVIDFAWPTIWDDYEVFRATQTQLPESGKPTLLCNHKLGNTWTEPKVYLQQLPGGSLYLNCTDTQNYPSGGELCQSRVYWKF